MRRTWTIIGVSDVPGSCKWYQALFGQPEHEVRHVFRVLAKHDLAAVRGDIALELFQVIVEMVDGVAFDVMRLRPQLLIIGTAVRRDGLSALFHQA